MANKNSWARRALLKLGERTAGSSIAKVGEKLGRPIMSATRGVRKSIDDDKKVMSMMRNRGLSGTIMGESNYNTAFKRIKGYVKDNDMSSANTYIQDQARKIKSQ
ncbi:MAG: hypothetical protein KAJ30_05610 [Candidatus Heimdallarchaeota archaeon]|nr:hypothetical protein [Candidatus Heimdallarchaeota archaeon]